MPYMDRSCDTRPGMKHRCTNAAMEYFRSEVMEMCHDAGLYQIDLLNGSKTRVTEREYWAKKKGQLALDEENAVLAEQGLPVKQTKFETDKDKLREEIRMALSDAVSFEDFAEKLLRRGITVKESRGRLSYLTPDRTKPITARKLGDDFDKAAVFAIFVRNTKRVRAKTDTIHSAPAMQKIINERDTVSRMVDIDEAIIDEETFARVQELRKNKRRPARTGKTNMFSGLVRCADCGEKLYYCTSNSFETRQDHFVCSTSRKKGKEVCDTHFIRAVVLEEGTLQHIRLVIQCVADYEDAFRRALGAKRSEEAKKDLSAKKRTLQKSENRLAELDRLFKRIYEDMVNGKLSETRFQMLADDYEQEQADLRAKIEMLENEIQNQEDQAENVDRFIRQAKKYLYLEKLTPTILNDMVNAVYVHAPDKSSGHRVQDVTISYNYIGILPANLLYDVMNGKAA